MTVRVSCVVVEWLHLDVYVRGTEWLLQGSMSCVFVQLAAVVEEWSGVEWQLVAEGVCAKTRAASVVHSVLVCSTPS